MIIENILRVGFALAGLLLPGVGWALAGRWPLPWLAAGVISALALFSGVVGFALAGIPITLPTLGGWLMLVGSAGGWRWWRRRKTAPKADRNRTEWWLALPVLPLVAVAVWRACAQPLWSADAVFRWNRLAELIVRTGHLDYYPATTTGDFSLYFWADGIAPLVSGVYAWVYLAMGTTDEVWTAIPVLLQVAGLLALLYQLGREWSGDRGGWLACGLGGATMLLQFAFNLGQETGATTLGAGGMILYLLRWHKTRNAGLLVPAALGAALAACAREYGIVVIFAGAAWLALAEKQWRGALWFGGWACLLPAVWHLRLWAFTGNPLYAQSFGGLLPTNAVFDGWMRNYQELYGASLLQGAGWVEIIRVAVFTALPALGGWWLGVVRWRREPGWSLVLLVTLLIGLAWLASVPFTAGGPFYSMRVLGPALLLGCAWGGAGLALWVPGRRHLAGLMLGLSLFAVDASLRALTIPANPYTVAPRDWPTAGDGIRRDFLRRDAGLIREAARIAPGKVLSDSAGLASFFEARGGTYGPLWSPDVAWLFDAADRRDAGAGLRALGYSHLLLKRSEISTDFLAKTGVLPKLAAGLRPVMANETFILFELQPAVPAAPPGR